jgi:glucosaminylphosphatidylinositol acyltransferase
MGYKEEHEAFVSGLTGSSVWMVVYVGLHMTLSNIVRSAVEEQLARGAGLAVQISLDVALLIAPTLLLLCYPETLALYVGGAFLVYSLISLSTKSVASPSPLKEGQATQLHFLTSYRSGLLMLTCLAILAVDFRIFPRYFAKTETFGYSLVRLSLWSVAVTHLFGLDGCWCRLLCVL